RKHYHHRDPSRNIPLLLQVPQPVNVRKPCSPRIGIAQPVRSPKPDQQGVDVLISSASAHRPKPNSLKEERVIVSSIDDPAHILRAILENLSPHSLWN